MATTMSLPELGENVESALVVKVLVAVGDRIERDQPVIEVETEKASVEVPATVSGTVSEIHAAEGEQISSGAAILSVAEDGAGTSPGSAADAAPSEPSSPPNRDDEPWPEEAQTEGEAPLRAAPEPQASVAAEAAVAPAPPAADTASQDREIVVRSSEPGDNVAPLWSGSPVPHKRVPAAPSVRRFAREVGIDITEVAGSGHGGRITSADVKEHVKAQLVRSSGGSLQAPPLPDFSRWGEVSFDEMTSVRRITAEQMTRAWHTVPQVTQHDLADISGLEDLRAHYRARIEASGGKLTLTAILVKVAATALRVFPNLNASIDMENKRIVRKHFVHIGVAVDTERGLLVPVIRDADRKSIAVIARELDDLAERARGRKLLPDEMQGGTFTISNLGGIGGTAFSPIVNWPEVAILGVSRGRLQPKWTDGQWQPRLMLPLSLSYDHRLVDGADAARFTRWVAEALESPLLLVLEG